MYKSKTIVIAVIAFFFSLQQSFGLEHIYNYEGVTSQSTEMAAYACDVDAFPFQGNQLYLNVKTKATNANYVAIAEDDAVMWQIGTPGAGDENFFWFDVKINENVNAVAQIDLQFNGRTSNISASFCIYVLKRNTDWLQNSSWVQIGTSQSVPPNTETVMIRSIKFNAADYIDPASGNITWCVYQASPSDVAVDVDYVGLIVRDSFMCNPNASPVYLLGDINQDCYVDFDDFAIFANNWFGDLSDIALFTEHWLQCSDPDNGGACDNFWSKHTTGIWYETSYSNEGHYTWIRDFGTGSTSRFLGDVDGDGKDDAVAYFDATGGWYVALSNGKNFSDGTLWKNGFGGNSAKQFLADVTGDGKKDAVVFYNGMGQGDWYVAPSTGTGFGAYSLWKSGFGGSSSKQFVKDVDGDGKADVVVYHGSAGDWYAALSTGSSFGAYSLWKGGFGLNSTDQLLADVTNAGKTGGDNKADVIVFYNGTGQGQWYVAPSTGTGFSAYSLWKSGVGSGATSRIVGNINGDGMEDILLYYNVYTDGTTGRWFELFSNGSAFLDPVDWKLGHGNGSRLLPVNCSWQGLGDVYGTGKDAPVVFYSTEGVWKAMPADNYYVADALNFWDIEDIRYVPRTLGGFAQYDSGDPNVIDEHISMITEAGIDFVILDYTNYINYFYIKERGLKFIERLAIWNANNQHRPLKYAVAVGWAGLTRDGASMEYEAGVVWDDFINNPKCPASNYFTLDGKPLLVGFGSRIYYNAYQGDKTNTNRFTLRWGDGQIDADTATVYTANGPEVIPPNEYGFYYGWAFINGSLANNDAMVVMPGWNYYLAPIVSRVYNGVPGDRYKLLSWERVLANKPDMVIINSFNEYAEQTSVAPAESNDMYGSGDAEVWYNTNWEHDPNFYWNMTKSYNYRYKTE